MVVTLIIRLCKRASTWNCSQKGNIVSSKFSSQNHII
jgi:hypothetical protein